MTVREAKQQIIDLLQQLREDGIIVTNINVSWTAELPANVAKPAATMKASVYFEANL